MRRKGFVEDSFANSLKNAAACIFGWPRDLLEGNTTASRVWREKPDFFWSGLLGKKNFTPRVALQLLGTEAGRNVFGQELWSGSLIKRVSESGLPTVISDVRFPNEVEAIANRGGHVIRILRGNDPSFYKDALDWNRWSDWGNEQPQYSLPVSLNPEKGGEHSSEWAWIGHPGIMYNIDNNGTLGDLEEKVHYLLNSIEQK